jgi:hypothetical protein
VEGAGYGTFAHGIRPRRRKYLAAVLLSVAVIGVCAVAFMQHESSSVAETEELYYKSYKSGCVRPADYWRDDLKSNKVVKIHCYSDCSKSHGTVKGTSAFTLDSSPCVAAYKNGLIKGKAGDIRIRYAGLQTIYYRNQVGSELLQYNHGFKKEAFVFVLQACNTTKVVPNKAPAKGGADVTIIGENFGIMNDEPQATVGGRACAPTTWLSNKKILCRVPPGTGRDLPVAVTVTGRTSVLKNGFSYEAPKITKIVPNAGPAIGEVVTILGSNFGTTDSKTLRAKIGGKPCLSIKWVSDAKLLCSVPPLADKAHSLSISLDGNVGTLANAFVVNGPHVLSVEPSRWPATGKTTLTIHGTGFGLTDSQPVVTIGAAACLDTTWVNDKEITCQVQPGLAAELDVSVTVAGLKGTKDRGFELLAPQIDSITPSAFPATGGEKLVIQGESFGYYSVPVTVELGDYSCADAKWESNERISCVVPNGLSGVVDVRITVGENSAEKERAYTMMAPVITGITPAKLPSIGSGREITIHGSNFGYSDKKPTVLIGHTSCGGVEWLSNEQIRCAVPVALAGDADVTVTVKGNMARNPDGFHFSPPDVLYFEPPHLPATGGDMLTIHGKNFGFSQSTVDVKIGGRVCNKAKWVSDRVITCVAPAVKAGTMDVQVTVGPNTGENSGTFVMRAPKIKAVTPSQGPAAGGQVVTLVGSDFGFRDTNPVVHIGRNLCGNTKWVSNAAVTCQLPIGVAGVQDVSIMVVNNSATRTRLYTMLPPIVKQVLPSNGPKFGGSSITIMGENFGFIKQQPKIMLGTEPCMSPSWVSDTELTCTAPPGKPTDVTMTVEFGSNAVSLQHGWKWNDCHNVTFTDDDSHTTWNSYCAPDLCNYRTGDNSIMAFKFRDVTFNTPLQEAALVFSVALDDHYSIPPRQYSIDATLNGQSLTTLQPLTGVQHGAPSNSAFNNFVDYSIPIGKDMLSSVRSVDTNKVDITVHAGADNFVVVKKAALVVCS